MLSFESSYEPHIINQLFNSQYSDDLPFTGVLGASISSVLVKYFLGYGSVFICSILLMYAYVMFTQKDYTQKKYIILSLYQFGAGLWLSVFSV